MTTLYGSNAADQHQFLQRVTHLPMVALTLSHLTELYQQTKLRHDILTYALEKGEKTVWNGLDLASGIAQKTLPCKFFVYKESIRCAGFVSLP